MKENQQDTVIFLDSGIGGIPYMVHALNHIEAVRGVYFADTGFFPYGTKDPEELCERLQGIVSMLINRYNPRMFVLACNTASVVALGYLRAHFDVPFVGTVPAVKPAVIQSRNQRIGIMATEQTLRDPYLEELVSEYAAGAEITRVPATGLISGIETNFFNGSGRDHLEEIGTRFLKSGSDTVVLGCTHFIHLENELKKLWGDSIRLIDSREGISRQIYRILNNLDISEFPRIESAHLSPGELMERSEFFISSADDRAYYQRIAKHFSFSYGGSIDVS